MVPCSPAARKVVNLAMGGVCGQASQATPDGGTPRDPATECAVAAGIMTLIGTAGARRSSRQRRRQLDRNLCG